MQDTHTTVVGNLAADPVTREFDDGRSVTNFRVGATPRRYDRRTERWGDGPTSWWEVATFGYLAENVAASFRKGDRVVVSGRAWVEQWAVRDAAGTVEKSGVTARITAEAAGHDLAHGTSAFTRVVRSREVVVPGRDEVAASMGATVDANGELRDVEGLEGTGGDGGAGQEVRERHAAMA